MNMIDLGGLGLVSDEDIRELYQRVPSMDKKEIIEVSERFDIYYVKRASVIQSQHALQVGLKKKFATAFTETKAGPKPKKAPTPPERQYNDRMYIFLKEMGLPKEMLGKFHRQFSSLTLCDSGVRLFAEKASVDLLQAVFRLVFPKLGIRGEDGAFRDAEPQDEASLRQWLTKYAQVFRLALRSRTKTKRAETRKEEKPEKRSYPNRMYTRLKERGLSPMWLKRFHRQFSALTLNAAGVTSFVKEANIDVLRAVLDLVNPQLRVDRMSDHGARIWAEDNREWLYHQLSMPVSP